MRKDRNIGIVRTIDSLGRIVFLAKRIKRRTWIGYG
ncbi:hypothetical protein J2W91_004721 [Paenibacillus amylolyticus]|uniref:Uncharacterized protein n=1 Tax=Paenibacillus amylolyticus TaxID=1451 RepID=A0AAP5LR04_PAEAM|nr:hypothetical protein [Paenibacillus amylolyticus]